MLMENFTETKNADEICNETKNYNFILRNAKHHRLDGRCWILSLLLVQIIIVKMVCNRQPAGTNLLF